MRSAVSAVARAEPRIEGEKVRYDRGIMIEEYEMRRGGIEQTFIFNDVPPGEGDLVVSARVSTSLVASVEGREVEELYFCEPKLGTLAIRDVIGFDAMGASIRGRLRYEHDRLDIILPASFVEDAKTPIVLDPLIGVPFSTGWTGGSPALSAGAAYDAANNLFLVAWTEDLPSSFISLGRFVRPNGELVGPIICLECDPTYSSLGLAIVNIASKEMFVAWVGGYFPVAIQAATGIVRPETTIPTSAGILGSAVSGDVSSAGDNIVRAYFGPGGSVIADKFRVEDNGALTLVQSRQVGTGISPTAIVISKSGGLDGRYLVSWENQVQLTSAEISSVIIDRDLEVLDQRLLVTSTVGLYAADGDGRQWMVAYNSPSGLSATPLFWDTTDGVAWAGPETMLASAAPGTFLTSWGLGYAGESCLVSMAGGRDSFAVLSVDPFTCLPCEGRFPVTQSRKQIVTQRSGDPSSGEYALVVSELGITHVFRADDGVTTDLGGGCGSGGWSAATCARVGNEGFMLRLRDARHGVPALLAIGTQPLSFVCGPCSLLVDPLFVIGTGLTDSHGNAEVPLPLPSVPSLAGATFLMQWLTVAGTTCPLGLEFSNALRVQLQ